MSKKKYSPEHIRYAKELLNQSIYPRDALPYSITFDLLLKDFISHHGDINHHSFWMLLCRAGKEGGIIRNEKRKKLHVPTLTNEEAFEILRLCPEKIGSRDRLPYTTEFDEMYVKFKLHTKKRISKNNFWRILSRLAKRSRKPKPIEYCTGKVNIPTVLERHLFTMNPFWKGTATKIIPNYKRSIYKRLYDTMTSGTFPILSVRGPRQIGKTTLQNQLIDDLLSKRIAQPNQILRVQFDDLPSIGSLQEPISTIIHWYEENILKSDINEYVEENKYIFIFFDEIQNLNAWDSQLKFLVDHKDCRVYITGSSALRILEGRDHLAGRIDQYLLGPLSLTEIAGFRMYDKISHFDNSSNIMNWLDIDFWRDLSYFDGGSPIVLERTWRDYSEVGGYPYCHKYIDLPWGKLSRYLTTSVIDRTIDHDLKVGGSRRDSRILRNIFKIAARYVGQQPKMQTIAREIDEMSETNIQPSSILEYLEFLENSLLLKLIEPLEIRNKKQSSPRKICICDHIVRAAWLQEKIPLLKSSKDGKGSYNPDLAGHIIESVFGYYIGIFEEVNIFHFPERPSEPEVDFVIVIGDTYIPVEIKYRPDAFKPDYTRGLKSFLQKKVYNAPFGLIISENTCGIQDNIVAVPAKKILLLR